MENKDKSFVNDFLKILREQAAETEKKLSPDDLNKKIKNTITKLWRTESIVYKGSKKKGKSDIEYFAHNHARAGIGKEEGWESAKKAMDGFSVFDDELKAKYDAEYDRNPFDQDFRDGFVKH